MYLEHPIFLKPFTPWHGLWVAVYRHSLALLKRCENSAFSRFSLTLALTANVHVLKDMHGRNCLSKHL